MSLYGSVHRLNPGARFMKCLSISAVALVISIAAPAWADVVTETVAFSGSDENGLDFVSGPLFNPALGTLVGVTASVKGQFLADILTTSPGLPSHLNFGLDGTFKAPGVSLSGNVGGFTAAYNGSAYLSNAGFAFSDSIAAFGDYVEGSPNATSYLAALALGAISPMPLGASSDLSTWFGNLTITYCYDPASPVPEPGSLAILGVAGVIFAGMLGRSRISA